MQTGSTRLHRLAMLVLSAAFLLGGGLRSGLAAAEDDMAKEPAQAYMALTRGDEARDAGTSDIALAAFEEALARYQRIAKSRPDWESDIVQYRIIYCENQVRVLRAKIGAAGATAAAAPAEAIGQAEAPPPDAAVVPPVEAQVSTGPGFEERYHAAVQENEYLRQRLSELDEQEDDPAEMEQLRASAVQLRAQLAEAFERVSALDSRVAELETENRSLSHAVAQGLSPAGGSLPAGAEDAPAITHAAALREAMMRERMNDAGGALVVYGQILDENPGELAAVRGSARCLLASGSADKAVSMLAPVLRDHPDDANLGLLLGTALGSAGRYAEAVDVLAPAAKADVWNGPVHAALGAALMGAGRADEARVELEKAIVLDSQSADAHYNLAVLLSGGGADDMEKGRIHYQKSLDLQAPRDPALEKKLGNR